MSNCDCGQRSVQASHARLSFYRQDHILMVTPQELGVVFPQCSVSSLFGDQPREVSGSVKQSIDPCKEAIQDSVTFPNPGVSSPFQRSQSEDNLSVTFQQPLQSPFDTNVNSKGKSCAYLKVAL